MRRRRRVRRGRWRRVVAVLDVANDGSNGGSRCKQERDHGDGRRHLESPALCLRRRAGVLNERFERLGLLHHRLGDLLSIRGVVQRRLFHVGLPPRPLGHGVECRLHVLTRLVGLPDSPRLCRRQCAFYLGFELLGPLNGLREVARVRPERSCTDIERIGFSGVAATS